VSAVLSIRQVTLPGTTSTLQSFRANGGTGYGLLVSGERKGGYKNILVVTDALTKFVWAFPTTNSDA